MKQTLYFLSGLPSSGKSSWSKKLIQKEPNKWIRVNKDDLRLMLHNSIWSKQNENEVLTIRNEMISSALEIGKNVIVDDTNFAPAHLETIKKIIEYYEFNSGNKVKIIEKFFDVPLLECIERDKKRPNPVGEKVIRTMYNQYLHKEKNLPDNYTFKNYNDALPNAYIFDIDGTLAHHNGRSPYDNTKIMTDSVIVPVVNILDTLANSSHSLKIILLSGRDESGRKLTEKWLKEHSIFYNNLYMRKEYDKRKDTVIKSEMYKEYIKGNFNILGVFDDRPSVRRMWITEHNLFVFSCYQDPDFTEF